MSNKLATVKKDLNNVKEQVQDTSILERDYQNHNIIKYGLEELQHENKWDTASWVLGLFASGLHLNLNEHLIDNCYWTGRRRFNRPLLVRFTTTLARDAVLDRTRMLKGTKIRIERNFDFRTGL